MEENNQLHPPEANPIEHKKSSKHKPLDLEKDLISRLGYLRQAARETGHNYVVNLEYSLISLIDAVKQICSQEPGRKERDALERARDLIDEIKLKPAKGRRKDLKRIEKTISDLEKMLIKKKHLL